MSRPGNYTPHQYQVAGWARRLARERLVSDLQRAIGMIEDGARTIGEHGPAEVNKLIRPIETAFRPALQQCSACKNVRPVDEFLDGLCRSCWTEARSR